MIAKKHYGYKYRMILLHKIKYSYPDGFRGIMNEVDEEHIEKCIRDGISSGKLCTSNRTTTHYGWWEKKKKTSL